MKSCLFTIQFLFDRLPGTLQFKLLNNFFFTYVFIHVCVYVRARACVRCYTCDAHLFTQRTAYKFAEVNEWASTKETFQFARIHIFYYAWYRFLSLVCLLACYHVLRIRHKSGRSVVD